MIKKKSQYIYSSFDSAIIKNLYMYSSHDWDSFLNDYFEDRDLVLSQIKRSNIQLVVKSKKDVVINCSNQYDIKILIENSLTYSPDDPSLSFFLLFLLKKFEINKKILAHYGDNISKDNEISSSEYIKISYLLSKYLDSYFDLRLMNFLLKLNDRIIFMKNHWLGTDDEPYFFESISIERDIVQKLIKEIT